MNILVAIAALTSPVWIIYLVTGLIRWREYKLEKKGKHAKIS